MAKISEYTIEQVRSAADIVDVVSGYVDLKKRGRNFFGLCPFHSEKTASFSVNQDKQIYHCFGCGEGGGSIQFIMQMEKIEFIDAVVLLAEKYNLKIQYDGGSGRKHLIAQIQEIHEIARLHFRENLQSDEGKPVLDHLLHRGLTRDIIDKFGLGFSLDGWQTLLNVIRKKDFSAEAVLQCGLFINSDKGPYDRFRSRIMFPIANASGKTIAFAGRVFQTDLPTGQAGDPAKYVNSPETPIYHKSKVLYGLWAVKSQLRETNEIIIVEGYFDFLQLYQAGLQNMVAVSGTALTDDHATELRKYAKTIVMAYDGDSAGISAAKRAGYILLRNDLEPKVVSVPEGIDPDDWVKNEGLEPFKDAVKSAEGLISFHAVKFTGNLNHPTDKTKFAKEVLRELSTITDEITRQVYVQHLATTIGIDESALHTTLEGMLKIQRQRGLRRSEKPSNEAILENPDTHQPLEDEIIQLCFCNDNRLRSIMVNAVHPDWFNSSRNRNIFNQLATHPSGEALPDAAMVMDELINSIDRDKLSALVIRSDDIQATPDLAIDCLVRMEKRYLTRQIDEQRGMLKEIESAGGDFTSVIIRIEELKGLIRSLPQKYSQLFSN